MLREKRLAGNIILQPSRQPTTSHSFHLTFASSISQITLPDDDKRLYTISMEKNNDHLKTASPTEPGASRKRVRRACDECRLHKARCNGRQDCETCTRHNRECTYNLLPSECKGSAARIRILERRLLRAKEHIQDPKPQQLSHSSIADLQKIVIQPDNLNLPAQPSMIMESGSLRAFSPVSRLIEALLEPLAHHDDIRVLLRSDTTRNFLCNSTDGIVSEHPRMPFFHLPPYNKMLETARLAFNNILGLPSVILEQRFHVGAQKLYDINPIAYTREDAMFVPLFCGVMALGMLAHSRIELGCHNILNESQYYFEMAASTTSNKQEYYSVSELQVGLTLVLYLVNTSKLDVARRALQIITSSSIVRILSQASAVQSSEPQPDLFWVVHYLDSHISSFLGLTAQLHCPASATIAAINNAIWNVAIYRRSDSTFLLSVSLALAIESLRLIKRMMSDTVTYDTEPNTSLPDNAAVSAGLQRWADIEVELKTLESAVRRIFPDDDANLQISLARNELEMYLRISQIMLHHKFLLYHSRSLATNNPQQVNNINKGRACVIAASISISSISNRMEGLQTTILTWLSAYTVFISTITLLLATAFLENPDDYVQHNIEHTFRVALQILKHATYDAGQNRLPYLHFLLVVSARTNPQFEHILRNDMSVASTTSSSSCGSEISRIDSYPNPSSTFQQYGRNIDRSQRRSRKTLTESLGDWGFD